MCVSRTSFSDMLDTLIGTSTRRWMRFCAVTTTSSSFCGEVSATGMFGVSGAGAAGAGVSGWEVTGASAGGASAGADSGAGGVCSCAATAALSSSPIMHASNFPWRIASSSGRSEVDLTLRYVVILWRHMSAVNSLKKSAARASWKKPEPDSAKLEALLDAAAVELNARGIAGARLTQVAKQV